MSRLPLAVPLLLLFTVACGDAGDPNDGGPSNAGGAAPTAGTASSGGTSSSSAGTAAVTLTPSGQALGGGDQGSLFPVDGVVPIMPVVMGGTGSGGSAPVIPGDGNVAQSKLGGSIQGTATFTQTGEDVAIVVDLTGGCADGNHHFRIHDGGSCDSATTMGMPWSPRGTNLGPDTGIPCTGGKGKLNYTRSGADKTKNLTVGDHEPTTDLTTHVVVISDEKDPNSRASCGNFFY